jgi:hypothetical protein
LRFKSHELVLFFIKKTSKKHTYPKDWYTCAITKINPTMCHDE